MSHGARSVRSWGIIVAVAVLSSPGSVQAQAGGQPPNATPRPVAADGADSEPVLYAEPTRPDHAGRVLVQVEINGQGPFRFIVDTGANRSALAPGVVERLSLPIATGETMQVHGVTGTALLQSVHVESLTAGRLQLPPSELPVLTGDIFAGADGFLGVAGLEQMRLDVDFANNRVAIGPSNGRRAPSDFITVRGSMWQGGLLLVNGRVGSVPVKVIVDTGAERTMGNMQLRAAILTKATGDLGRTALVHGATPEVGEGTYFDAPTIAIGPVHLVDLPVTFADLHVFDLWGLTGEPALVVGMDVLGTLDRFVVDYRRHEFQIKPHSGVGQVIRRCTSSTCGSRIPEVAD
jgi:predicted aspartyl protease